MSDALTHGFRNLTRFSGRDRRGLFWPHAAIVFALVFLVTGTAMIFVMATMFGDMHAFAAAHPEAVTIESSPGQYSMQVDPTYPGAPIPDFTLFFATVMLGSALGVALLAAAVSRRLHDTGRAAWWGLAPAILLGLGLVAFPLMMQDFMTSEMPNMALFAAVMVCNLTYNATLIALIVVLALPGTRGPNRYGPAT